MSTTPSIGKELMPRVTANEIARSYRAGCSEERNFTCAATWAKKQNRVKSHNYRCPGSDPLHHPLPIRFEMDTKERL